MDGRGWGLSGSELLEVRYLDWLGERASSDKVAPASAFLAVGESAVTADDRAALVVVVRDLHDRGLVGGQRRQSGWLAFSGRLTPEGHRVVAERKRRRGSRKERAVAARDSLLDWMYENVCPGSGETPELETFLGTPRAMFEGDPFTTDEVNTASTYLRDEEFIAGIRASGGPAVMRPRVTSKGQRAVETGQYTAEPDGRGGTVNHVTIGGDNYGQAGAGNVTQQQTNGVDPGTFADLVSNLRAALEDLDEKDRARADLYVRMIEGEVSSTQPDRGVLDATRNGLRHVADKVADKTVGVGVDALWAYIASRLGLSDGS